jgi:hypothetical protein
MDWPTSAVMAPRVQVFVVVFIPSVEQEATTRIASRVSPSLAVDAVVVLMGMALDYSKAHTRVDGKDCFVDPMEFGRVIARWVAHLRRNTSDS